MDARYQDRVNSVKSLTDSGETSTYKISILTGIPRRTVRRIVEGLRKGTVTSGQAQQPASVLPGGANEWKESGNSTEATYTTNQDIHTLEELLDFFEVDLNVWHVERWIGKKWSVGAKDANGDIVKHPLFQVKAWFVRKVASETKFPIVTPINITVSRPRFRPIDRPVKTALIIPDIHFGYARDMVTGQLYPFHDRKALSVVLQLAALLQPDRIICLGDTLDCAEFSDKFVKSPEFYFTFQPSVIEAAWYLGLIASSVSENTALDLVEGNHDKRIRLAMINHMVAAYDIKAANTPRQSPAAFSVPELLRLDQIGWKYWGDYPNDRVWINRHLMCQHGDVAKSRSGATVNSVIRDTQVSVIMGHIHRNEQVSATRFGASGAQTYTVISCGTLARLDGVVPAQKKENNWQQGCAVVFYEPDGREYFHIVPVPINAGRAVWCDRVLEGADYSGQLSQDTGWKF